MQVFFSEQASASIYGYLHHYREYHEHLYEDSGLWNEDLIVLGYKKEATKRYTEIVDSIIKNLSNPIITYTNPRTIVRWRTKMIIVDFSDQWEIRTIERIVIG